jgi:hypothetical protein
MPHRFGSYLVRYSNNRTATVTYGQADVTLGNDLWHKVLLTRPSEALVVVSLRLVHRADLSTA